MTVLGSNPRADVDTEHPSAFGICDRCGFLYNLKALQWQTQWQGLELVNLNILVCEPCLDVPNENLRTIILPPDPESVPNARPSRWMSLAGPTPPAIPVVDLLAPDDD